MTFAPDTEAVIEVIQLTAVASASNAQVSDEMPQTRNAVANQQPPQAEDSLLQPARFTARACRSTCITEAQLRAAAKVLECQLRRASPQCEAAALESTR